MFSKWQGAKYCLACTSGGVAIQLALRSSGVKPGDKVLANAFTLAPVPGAIENVGAKAVLVDINDNFHIDLNDLELKAKSSAPKLQQLHDMGVEIIQADLISAAYFPYYDPHKLCNALMLLAK